MADVRESVLQMMEHLSDTSSSDFEKGQALRRPKIRRGQGGRELGSTTHRAEPQQALSGKEIAGKVLQAPGQAMDALDKTVGIPGTNINVYNARHAIIDPLTEAASKVHPMAGVATNIGAEMLIPDSTLYAGKIIKGGTKVLKGASRLLKGPELATEAIRIGDRVSDAYRASDDLTIKSAQPLQAASNMQVSTRSDQLKGLVQADVGNVKIREFLESGPGKALRPEFTKREGYWTAQKLASQPELLETIIARSELIKAKQLKYQKAVAKRAAKPNSNSAKAAVGNAQREWYDEVSKNFFTDDLLIYGKDKPRQLVAQATRWVTRSEWHHIFGNKEAGEFLLSAAAQDPLIAVNLMAHMKKLKLNSSGIAKNITIMNKAGHTNLHTWLKELGFESVAGKQAPLAIDQFGTEISKVATEGYTTKFSKTGKPLKTPKDMPADPEAVNELFTILEQYAKANEFIKTQIRAGKVTMPDGTVLSLSIGKASKAPEIMSELKSKKISGLGDVLKSGELMKTHQVGRTRKKDLLSKR